MSIPITMKTAVMYETSKIRFEERKVPSPSRDSVLVKLEYVGICGSDAIYSHMALLEKVM